MVSNFLGKRNADSSFVQNAGIVMVGTVIAQILPLLFYPIFTRLYTPSDFGTFATISMIATPLAIVASGAYEQAFLLTRSVNSLLNLLGYLALRTLVVLAVAFILLVLLRHVIAKGMDDQSLAVALLCVPVISFGQVIYNCTSEWLVRQKDFKHLALNRIWHSGLVSMSKLGFAIVPLATSGLVLGEAVGRVTYAISTAQIWRKPLGKFSPIRRRRMIASGKRFSSFPRLVVPDQLINTFGGSVHVLLIGFAFGPVELGYISLIFSALYLPVTVVSSSIKDVFRQRASVEYAQTHSCRPTYLKLVGPIALLGLCGFGLLYVLSPWVFRFVFGDQWAVVGDYAQILMPMFFFNFVSMSLGGVLIIANQMAVSLRWQITSLITTVAALLIGIYMLKTVEGTLVAFTIARSLNYLHYGFLSYRYAKREPV